MADERAGPTMREILESMRQIQFGHMLGEIEAIGSRVNGIISNGPAESWDYEALRKCAQTITFHGEALESTVANIMGESEGAERIAERDGSESSGGESGPIMRESLDTFGVDELKRVLGEITENARRIRGIVSCGASDAWDHETLLRYAQSVAFYAGALERGVTNVVGRQKSN